MIILNVKLALFYYIATRDSSSRKPRFYLQLMHNIHCAFTKSDVTEWLLRWPENLKQAVKYERDISIEKAFTKGLTIFKGTFLCCLSLG